VSQDYKPLLKDYNEWKLKTCYQGDCSYDVYFTDSDTLFGGYNYKVLDGFHFISRTFLLREDVDTRKVYLTKINPNKSITYLLYDFSLALGDSFLMVNPISPINENGGFFYLDSIEYQIEGTDSLKYFYFSPTLTNSFSVNNAIWIEGVGSLSLINTPSGDSENLEIGRLVCFFSKNELKFQEDFLVSYCVNDYQLSLNEIVETTISVAPNPANDFIFIKGEADFYEIDIRSSLSELLYVNEKCQPNRAINLDLKPGIYFVTIKEINSLDSIVVKLFVN